MILLATHRKDQYSLGSLLHFQFQHLSISWYRFLVSMNSAQRCSRTLAACIPQPLSLVKYLYRFWPEGNCRVIKVPFMASTLSGTVRHTADTYVPACLPFGRRMTPCESAAGAVCWPIGMTLENAGVCACCYQPIHSPTDSVLAGFSNRFHGSLGDCNDF